ncbi:SPW repeat domain-containing protein [Aureimonas jatrophae]|uniref:SPW repeat-containing protein n=1 Tax=Aureimonas jatrophae TaxID=1166073 RepID=A0A1H0MJ77_9HYPH|nr:SPW repeat protein [Aureimonas jatrophae]MBB3952930.1 putative membrane protein [Aureimonas jatrophae]SDO80499.1 SPW repeat-containing protein [Aureimonas jatrophae]
MIPTQVHGVIDYVYGVLLVVAPFLIGFVAIPVAAWILVLAGVGAILYSLLTDYELGLYRLIPMTVHLALDVVAGVFLVLSPWLFGFADRIWWPHVVAGAISIVVPLFTSRLPS